MWPRRGLTSRLSWLKRPHVGARTNGCVPAAAKERDRARKASRVARTYSPAESDAAEGATAKRGDASPRCDIAGRCDRRVAWRRRLESRCRIRRMPRRTLEIAKPPEGGQLRQKGPMAA